MISRLISTRLNSIGTAVWKKMWYIIASMQFLENGKYVNIVMLSILLLSNQSESGDLVISTRHRLDILHIFSHFHPCMVNDIKLGSCIIKLWPDSMPVKKHGLQQNKSLLGYEINSTHLEKGLRYKSANWLENKNQEYIFVGKNRLKWNLCSFQTGPNKMSRHKTLQCEPWKASCDWLVVLWRHASQKEAGRKLYK